MASLLRQAGVARAGACAARPAQRAAGLTLLHAARRPAVARRAPGAPRAAADPQQQPPAGSPQPPQQQQQAPGERQVVYNTEFGYSRKDIFLIGGGLIGLGYAMYYGLQAMGMEPGIAGNWVQAIIFLGICVGWVSTYLYRVATKQMTYVKQLEMYEEAVMRKRMEEMTDAEMQQLMQEVDTEKGKRGGGGGGAPGGGQ